MPPLPSPAVLARWLRDLQASLWVCECVPEFVSLRLWVRTWELALADGAGYGRVVVPVEAEGFDALQAARQLLLAAVQGQRADGSYEPPAERHAWLERYDRVSERYRTMALRDRRRWA